MVKFRDQELRYEIKFTLDRAEFIEFDRWLAAHPFIFRSYPKRRVCSIYFDDIGLSSAENNVKGLCNRTKIRVRAYGDIFHTSSPLTLELKGRRARLGYKVSDQLTIKVDELLAMKSEDVCSLFSACANVSTHLKKHVAYVPTLYVTYNRNYLRWAEGLRITVDEEVRFEDMLKGTKNSKLSSKRLDKRIIEFKFPPHLKNHVSELMRTLPNYPTRSSKYVTGLSMFGHVVHI